MYSAGHGNCSENLALSDCYILILAKPNISIFVINKKRVSYPIANEKNILVQNYPG